MAGAASAHPTHEELSGYVLGRLGGRDSEAVESHLEHCQACCDAADSVPPDAFVQALRAESPTGEHTMAHALEPPAALRRHPRYRVLEFLGAGGMGAVYRARHVVMDRLVALKVLRPDLVADSGRFERFHREVKAAARLTHPNIVTAFDAEQVDDMHFLVMEYVEGESLAELVRRGGPLPVALACEYVCQAAKGLAHAHAGGLVHRDIKPHNLILAKDGGVKILDFGLARLHAESATSATETGLVMGTPDYMAPEQGTDSARVDHRADVYALGCTLYHLLAGRPPFTGASAVEKLLAHQTKLAAPLPRVRGDVPEALARIVERMMSKDPAHRFQSAAEAEAALRPFAQDNAAMGLAGTRSAPASPRRRVLRWAAGVMGLAAAVLLLVLWPRRQPAGGDDPVHPPKDDQRAATPVEPVASPREVRPWPIRQVASFDVPEQEVLSVAISPNGKTALLGTRAGQVRRWDLASRKEMLPPLPHPDEDEVWDVWSVAFSPDGKWATSAGGPWFARMRKGRPIKQEKDYSIRLWDTTTWKEIRRFTGHTDVVYGVAFSRDGQRLVSCCHDGTLRLWDIETGRSLRTTKRLGGKDSNIAIWGVAMAADGRHVASASSDGLVRVLDIEMGEVIHQLVGHRADVRSVAFSADGRRLLSGGLDGTMRLWDVQAGKQLRQFDGCLTGVSSVAFSSDGRLGFCSSGARLVSENGGFNPYKPDAYDCRLRCYDLATGELLASTAELGGTPVSLAFVDERHVLSGSFTRAAYLFALPALGKRPRPTPPPDRFVRLRWDAEALRLGKIHAPDLTAAGKPIYHDELDDSRVTKLGEIEKDELGIKRFNHLGYEAGRYFISTHSDTICSWRVDRWGMFTNFACRTVCRSAGPGAGQSGFTFDSDGRKIGLEVLIGQDGDLEVRPSRRFTLTERAHLPHFRVKHPAIRPGTEFNTLLVILRGRLLEVYVNDTAVCDPVLLDVDLTPCWVGLIVGATPELKGKWQKIRAEFERITLWSPEGIPWPQERGAAPMR